ncbi:alpha/beta hydrolase family protein [Ectobacillus panaciterrae]|uniref:alpha/beta hydrolase family protein n=1 Tax=Ectobacillus panaciterrae TaxID=363872 RepID=UPI00040862C0|nr:prolyl oligopeptidase family serine peptidase [Ectobacillus panaciterrae]
MIYHVTYLSNGLRVKGYLGLPNDFDLPAFELKSMIRQFYGSKELPITEIASSINPKKKDMEAKFPALIYCRGGIGKVGRVKTDWIEQFTSFGYIVFAPSYRGNEGGEGRDEFGGNENEDVVSAYRLLHSSPFVDTERISIMGFSRGAINAALTAAKITNIHKLILWGGVSDLAQTYEERIDLRRMLKRVLGGTPNKIPGVYQDRSPILMAKHIQCPVLIMHGTQDVQVDFSHGLNMYRTLKELEMNTEMHCYEGYGHHLPPPVHKAALQRMFDWIDKDLC